MSLRTDDVKGVEQRLREEILLKAQYMCPPPKTEVQKPFLQKETSIEEKQEGKDIVAAKTFPNDIDKIKKAEGDN